MGCEAIRFISKEGTECLAYVGRSAGHWPMHIDVGLASSSLTACGITSCTRSLHFEVVSTARDVTDRGVGSGTFQAFRIRFVTPSR